MTPVAGRLGGWEVWRSQECQYPASGPPGLSYFRGDVGPGMWVDCLLHRDEDGALTGILNHYPMDFLPYERAGAVTVWTRPDRRRRGIGSLLVREALARWPVAPLSEQTLSPEGALLVAALREEE